MEKATLQDWIDTLPTLAATLRDMAEDWSKTGPNGEPPADQTTIDSIRDWRDIVNDQATLSQFIVDNFADGKVDPAFVCMLSENGKGLTTSGKIMELLKLAIEARVFCRKCPFIAIPAKTSKGDEWWACFPHDMRDDSAMMFAVSEVSPEDAIEKAKVFLAEHGWREEMGEEVAILLVKQYERGREHESASMRKTIKIND